MTNALTPHLGAVVRSGQVIDQGSHTELVKKGGFYATLVARQTFDPGNDGMDDAREVRDTQARDSFVP